MKKLLLALMLTSLYSLSSEITLTPRNHASLKGEINDQSIADLQMTMMPMLATYPASKAFFLVIDSPGGSIGATLDLLETLKPFKNVKVLCLACASAAHHILQAVPNERLILASSVLMAHRARTEVSGQVESGELEARLKMIKALVRSMEQVNADRIGITLEQYKKSVLNEWWLLGPQAIAANHADKIVTAKCHPSLYQTDEYQVRSIFGAMTVRESRCPLIRGYAQ